MRAASEAEFRNWVRSAFEFLCTDFGFVEEAIPEYGNPYSVHFRNATTRVAVEGINWGSNARVALGSTMAERFENYDLLDVLGLRCPDLRLSVESRKGQSAQLIGFAEALRGCEATGDILRGDFSIFPEVQEVVNRRAAKFRELD